MPRALSLLRNSESYRATAFADGLRACGFTMLPAILDPGPDDVLLTWNRGGGFNETASRFERAGARVLVAENGYLGKSWRGGKWFAMALGHHAGAGQWRDGGPARWDGWSVELKPWREGGTETVILDQRGIGEPGIASPAGWTEQTARRFPFARIRRHPGRGALSIPLEADLADAKQAITWHSAAALGALAFGVPVFHEFPRWIGAPCCRPLSELGKAEPMRDDAARLAMFRRLAWSTWNVEEVLSGEAFAHLLER